MSKILLLENPHTSADETFNRYGMEVVRVPGSLDEDDLIEALQGFDMVGIRSKTNLTERVMENSPQLQLIGTFSIGTNQIDLDAAAKRGIPVFNAPYSNTRSVVEMVIAELISLYRHLPEHNARLQRGDWQKSAAGSREVRGKTLGIIGYGSIGSQLSVVAEALGMTVIFYDVAEKLAIGNAQRAKSLDELLAVSDVVSLHIDGRPANKGFFSRDMFNKMKKGSVFINLARGQVADLDALREKLLDGSIIGAGIDVYPTEPKKNGDEFTSVLRSVPNVILTPHVGGSTLEAQEDIGHYVSNKLMNYWRKGETEMSVNIPNLGGAPSTDVLHRIGWIHRNTPGALARVNHLFAQAGANITYQSLATEGEYGYMVTDLSSEIPPQTLDELRASEAHIRLRVLDRPNA
ncbi:MAG: phosphoglycerate dehydrogenase [Actinomycetaceae bacterium]|nr:phosphoglycerate dehydrogenase [Arcanobacterium sp.]MDD7504835.1 phosphoglycerate dehydrogenase [Actinomycetaceae bacterium]MDY6142781.1 phosphoglycerate dehydrogenase [Arcanobacterium sp.]